jgi:hypothetical protein|tara:strand:+ start:1580 stop:1984 length:405 start_codon:yes stop_codon:yes gene_type:complete
MTDKVKGYFCLKEDGIKISFEYESAEDFYNKTEKIITLAVGASKMVIVPEEPAKPKVEIKKEVSKSTPVETTEKEEKVSLEMIRTRAKELMIAGKSEKTKDLITSFQVPSLSDLPKDQYSNFYKGLEYISLDAA